MFHILFRCSRYEFRRAAYFKHVVETDLQKPVQYNVYIVQVVELPVKSGRNHGDFVFIIVDHVERVKTCEFCLMWTQPYALAARNAPFVQDFRLAVSHTDCLGRTSFHTGYASLAFIGIEHNGIQHRFNFFVHFSLLNYRFCQSKSISMVSVVPTPTSVSIFNLSEYVLIFGSPIPAPKPRFLTSSVAVE